MVAAEVLFFREGNKRLVEVGAPLTCIERQHFRNEGNKVLILQMTNK